MREYYGAKKQNNSRVHCSKHRIYYSGGIRFVVLPNLINAVNG